MDLISTLLIVFITWILTYGLGILLISYFYRNKVGLELCESELFNGDFEVSKYINDFKSVYFRMYRGKKIINSLFLIAFILSFFDVINNTVHFSELLIMIGSISVYTALNTLFFTKYKMKTLKYILKENKVKYI